MFEEVPVKIIWFYKRWQPAYDEMQKTIPIIEFEDSLPAEDFSTLAPVKTGGEGYFHWIIVLDDLMSAATSSDTILSLFTEGSHHLNASIFFITQNMFYQAKHTRSISLNCQTFILWRSPRSALQVRLLAREMYCNKKKYECFLNIYDVITSQDLRNPMILDLNPRRDERKRILSHILPGQQCNAYEMIE